MVEREREVITEFIGLYRDMPCLWDTSSDNYKDLRQRNVSWEILVKKLREIDPDANTASVKKKVENLKSAYKREAKKVKESQKRSGSGALDIHVPNLWYFKLLTFLDKKDEQEQSISDSVVNEVESHHNDPILSVGRSCSHNIRRKVSNARVLEHKKRKLIDTAQELLERLERNPKESSFPTNAFGVYVGEQLENLSTFQRQVAEKLIAEVIFLAKTENLNFDSRVETPSTSNAFQGFPSHSPTEVLSPRSVRSPQSIKFSPSNHVKQSVSPPCNLTMQAYSPQIIKRTASCDTLQSLSSDSFHSPQVLYLPPSQNYQSSVSLSHSQQHNMIKLVQPLTSSAPLPQAIEKSDETESPSGPLLKELLINKLM